METGIQELSNSDLSALLAGCNATQRAQAEVSLSLIIEALSQCRNKFGDIFYIPLRTIQDITGLGLKTVAKWMSRLRHHHIVNRLITGVYRGYASVYDLASASFNRLFSVWNKWGNTSTYNKINEENLIKVGNKAPEKILNIDDDNHSTIDCTGLLKLGIEKENIFNDDWMSLPDLNRDQHQYTPGSLKVGHEARYELKKNLLTRMFFRMNIVEKQEIQDKTDKWYQNKILAPLLERFRVNGFARHPFIERCLNKQKERNEPENVKKIFESRSSREWWNMLNGDSKYASSLRVEYGLDLPKRVCPECRCCGNKCDLHFKITEAHDFGATYWKCMKCNTCMPIETVDEEKQVSREDYISLVRCSEDKEERQTSLSWLVYKGYTFGAEVRALIQEDGLTVKPANKQLIEDRKS